MDLLSITASVLAISEVVGKIIFIYKNYIANTKNAPNNLRIILIKVGSIKYVFKTLELLLPKNNLGVYSTILQKLRDNNSTLKRYSWALKVFKELFPEQVE